MRWICWASALLAVCALACPAAGAEPTGESPAPYLNCEQHHGLAAPAVASAPAAGLLSSTAASAPPAAPPITADEQALGLQVAVAWRLGVVLATRAARLHLDCRLDFDRRLRPASGLAQRLAAVVVGTRTARLRRESRRAPARTKPDSQQ